MGRNRASGSSLDPGEEEMSAEKDTCLVVHKNAGEEEGKGEDLRAVLRRLLTEKLRRGEGRPTSD